jgi:hypothetical protein
MQQLMFKLDQNPNGRGLRCDGDGLFLGYNALLQKNDDGKFEARSDSELQKTLGRIYGDEATWGSHIRSVKLVANALNKGDMARAMMSAVLMRLPDPGDPVRTADTDDALAKAGYDPEEARDERGRWTNGGSGEATPSGAHRDARIQLAEVGGSDASNDPVAEAVARAAATARQNDAPKIVLAAVEEDDKEPRFRGDNYPPLAELIPRRLLQSPAGPALEFLDNLLDISGTADEANLEAATVQLRNLLHAIHQVDPNYVHESIEPIGGLARMSWQERLNVTRGLQADLAAAIYRVRGDIRPLQEVTLDFMQRATNATYDEAVELYKAGKLNIRLSPGEAIGNYVDDAVRIRLGLFFDGLEIPTDPESAIRVNRRAYNSSGPGISYRLPDVRVGNFAFDVSLRAKQRSDPQIRGFFNADFKPIGVVIVRPNQLSNTSSYIIWRTEGD